MPTDVSDRRRSATWRAREEIELYLEELAVISASFGRLDIASQFMHSDSVPEFEMAGRVAANSLPAGDTTARLAKRWMRATLLIDLTCRFAILVGIAVLLWTTRASDFLFAMVSSIALAYGMLQLFASSLEIHLLRQREVSAVDVRRFLWVVTFGALPRLLWLIPVVRDRGRDGWMLVGLGLATVVVAASGPGFEIYRRTQR